MALFGRKSGLPLKKVDRDAWMTIEGSFAARKCRVLDMSDLGAKIKVDDPQFVRPVFDLKFERTGQGLRCKVKWQKGSVIGVEFA
jgi:hypothetical protein